MLKKIAIVLCLSSLLLVGCSMRRGDIKVQFVIEGQSVPFDGWNVGPELFRLKGEPAKVTGYHIWANGLDPNDLYNMSAN